MPECLIEHIELDPQVLLDELLVGIRGIPAQYGGSETAAEEIYPRLVARGHDAVRIAGATRSMRRRSGTKACARLCFRP